jgi:hypothetical protein
MYYFLTNVFNKELFYNFKKFNFFQTFWITEQSIKSAWAKVKLKSFNGYGG